MRPWAERRSRAGLEIGARDAGFRCFDAVGGAVAGAGVGYAVYRPLSLAVLVVAGLDAVVGRGFSASGREEREKRVRVRLTESRR